ncbi:titin-like isoform X2 [Durio zibethinus]|uniref:Titin-like isoform X2 n=1 Tax=Durio zibethinus TaxID=66656 RepID=A0A6P5YLY4_DURZI|nr:titin-like isoform X2 [Durio zibethinus]
MSLIEKDTAVSEQKTEEESKQLTLELCDKAVEFLPGGLKKFQGGSIQPAETDEYSAKAENMEVASNNGVEAMNTVSEGNPEISKGEGFLISPEISTVANETCGMSGHREVDDTAFKAEKIPEDEEKMVVDKKIQLDEVAGTVDEVKEATEDRMEKGDIVHGIDELNLDVVGEKRVEEVEVIADRDSSVEETCGSLEEETNYSQENEGSRTDENADIESSTKLELKKQASIDTPDPIIDSLKEVNEPVTEANNSNLVKEVKDTEPEKQPAIVGKDQIISDSVGDTLPSTVAESSEIKEHETTSTVAEIEDVACVHEPASEVDEKLEEVSSIIIKDKSQATIESREEIKCITGENDGIQDKNALNTSVMKTEELCSQEVDNQVTCNLGSDIGTENTVESPTEESGQSEITEKTDQDSGMSSNLCKDYSNSESENVGVDVKVVQATDKEPAMTEASDELKREEDSTVPMPGGDNSEVENVDFVQQSQEGKSEKENAETSTSIKEVTSVKDHEERLEGEGMEDKPTNTDADRENGESKRKDQLQIEVNENTETVEVEISNKNADDFHVADSLVGQPVEKEDRKQYEFSDVQPEEQVHEAIGASKEKQEDDGDVSEACQSRDSTNPEHIFTEAAATTDLKSETSEMDKENVKEVYLLGSEKCSESNEALENKEEGIQRELEDCTAEKPESKDAMENIEDNLKQEETKEVCEGPKSIIKEECAIIVDSPKSNEEDEKEETPEVEVCEKQETDNTVENAEKQILQEDKDQATLLTETMKETSKEENTTAVTSIEEKIEDDSKAENNFEVSTSATDKEDSLEKENKEREPEIEVYKESETAASVTTKENPDLEEYPIADISNSSISNEIAEESIKEGESSPMKLTEEVSNSNIEQTDSIEETTKPNNDPSLFDVKESKEEITPIEVKEDLVHSSSFELEESKKDSEEKTSVKGSINTADLDSTSCAEGTEETNIKEAEAEEEKNERKNVLSVVEDDLATTEHEGIGVESTDIDVKPLDSSITCEKDMNSLQEEDGMQDKIPNAGSEDQMEMTTKEIPSKEILGDEEKEPSTSPSEEYEATLTVEKITDETSEKDQAPYECSETPVSQATDEILMQNEDNPTLDVPKAEAEDTGKESGHEVMDHMAQEPIVRTEKESGKCSSVAETNVSNVEEPRELENQTDACEAKTLQDEQSSDLGLEREKIEEGKSLDEATDLGETSCKDGEKAIEEKENLAKNLEKPESLKEDSEIGKDDTELTRGAHDQIPEVVNVNDNAKNAELALEGFEEKPKSDFEPVAEDQSKETFPETSTDVQNQETEKQIKEEQEDKLENEDYINREENANEVTKAVILSEEVDKEVEKADDSKDIKQEVMEEDGSENELHPVSKGDETTNEVEVEAYSSVSTECLKENKEQIEAENSEVEEHSTNDREASHVIKELEERRKDEESGDPVSVHSEDRDAEEKIEEIIDDSKLSHDESHIVAVTEVKAETSLNNAEVNEKIVNTSNISSVKVSLETIESDANQETKEVENVQLEEISSDLATQVPTKDNDQVEKQSLTVESVDKDETDEIKRDPEAFYMPNDQAETEKSLTVEKVDQLNSDHELAETKSEASKTSNKDELGKTELTSDGDHVSEDKGTEQDAETTKSLTAEGPEANKVEETKGEPETSSVYMSQSVETILKDDTSSPSTLPEEKLEEQLQTSTCTLPSEEEEIRAAHTIENIEEEIQKDAEIKHESLEDSSDTKTIEEVCLPNEEQREPKTVPEEETIADEGLQNDEPEEQIETTSSTLPSEDGTGAIGEEVEFGETKEEVPTKLDVITGDEKTGEQTLSANKPEGTACSPLVSKEKEEENISMVENKEEEKINEADIPDKISEDSSNAKKMAEICLEKEEFQELEVAKKDETAAAQALQVKEPNEQSFTSALPAENIEHGTKSNKEENQCEKTDEGNEIIPKEEAIDDKEVSETSYSTSHSEELTKDGSGEDEQKDKLVEDKTYEELNVEAQKISENDTTEKQVKDKTVEDPGEASAVRIETTTVTEEESSAELSAAENSQIIDDIQQPEEATKIASDEQIPRELDPQENTEIQSSISKELVPIGLQDRVAESSQKSEVGDEHGGGKSAVNSGEEITEESTSVEDLTKISSSDHVESSTKETLQVTQDVIKKREATDETNASQILLEEKPEEQTEKQIKEEPEDKLEDEDHINRDENANEVTKAVILSEEIDKEVEKADDSEDIKEHIMEEESSTNELHPVSKGNETTNEVEDYSSVSTECLKEAGSKEQIEGENSEVEEHSTNDREASHVIKELEERTQDEESGDPVSVQNEHTEAEEKIEEIIDDSKLCHDESHIEAVTEVKAQTSLNDAEVNEEIVNTSNINSVKVSLETIESDANQETKELKNVQLEEISSDLTPQVPTNDNDEVEKQSLNVETVDKDEADEIKRDPEAFYMPNDQAETEKSLTVEKLDKLNRDHELVETKSEASKTSNKDELGKIELASDGDHVSEDKGTERDAETTKSLTAEELEANKVEETKGEPETSYDYICQRVETILKDDISSPSTLPEEKTEEQLQISTCTLPSEEEEIRTAHPIENIEEEIQKDAEIKHESLEDSSDTKTIEEVCLPNEEQREPKTVSGEETIADHGLQNEEPEEQIETTSSTLPSEERVPSEEREHGTGAIGEEIQYGETKEEVPKKLDVITGGEITGEQTLLANKPEGTACSPLVSKEKEEENISIVEKTEEEKINEADIPDRISEDSSEAKKTAEIYSEKEEFQELEDATKDETASAQALQVEEPNEQSLTSALPAENIKHGATADEEENQCEKTNEGNEIILNEASKEEVIDDKEVTETSYSTKDGSEKDKQKDKLVEDKTYEELNVEAQKTGGNNIIEKQVEDKTVEDPGQASVAWIETTTVTEEESSTELSAVEGNQIIDDIQQPEETTKIASVEQIPRELDPKENTEIQSSIAEELVPIDLQDRVAESSQKSEVGDEHGREKTAVNSGEEITNESISVEDSTKISSSDQVKISTKETLQVTQDVIEEREATDETNASQIRLVEKPVEQTEKQIKEEPEDKLEDEDHINRDENANVVTKAVILSEEIDKEVEKADDSEDIKEHIMEEESSINELHPQSKGNETTNEVEDNSSVSTECLKEADSKEQIEAGNKELEEHSTNDREASHVIKELEERTQDEEPGDPVNVQGEDREAEEKIEEISDDSKLCHDKSHIEAVTEVRAETSLNDTQGNEEIVNTSNTNSVKVSLESIESDADKETREVENVHLEEISSNLAHHVPTNDNDEVEKQSLNMETVDKDEADEIKRDPEAFYMPNDQVETEKSITADEDHVSGDKGAEQDAETTNSLTAEELEANKVEETKGEPETSSYYISQRVENILKDDISSPSTLPEEQPAEQLQTSACTLPSQDEEVRTAHPIEKIEEEIQKNDEVKHESLEYSSDTKTIEEVCLPNEDQSEPNTVSEEETIADQGLQNDEPEEQIETASSVSPSEEREHGTGAIGEEMQYDETKKEVPTKLDVIRGDEITGEQTLSANEPEGTACSPLVSKEKEEENISMVQKTEEEKINEADILNKISEDTSDAKKMAEIYSEKEEFQKLADDKKDETASAQALQVEEPNEQSLTSALPAENIKHGTAADEEENQCEKTNEGNEIILNEVSKEEVIDDKEVTETSYSTSHLEELTKDGSREDKQKDKLVEDKTNEELNLEAQKTSGNEIIEKQIEDKTVEDPGQGSVARIETTTVTEEESSTELSAAEGNQIIDDIQQPEQATKIASDEQIPRELDPKENKEIQSLIAKELVPIDLQDRVSESSQKSEVGDVKEIYPEVVEHGAEKPAVNSGEEITEEPTSVEASTKISSSDHVESSTKETLQVTQDMIEERGATDETNASQILLVEKPVEQTEKQIKEELEDKLEDEDHSNREENANEVTKAVILSEEIDKEVEKADDSEDIKEHVMEEESSSNEFHPVSKGNETTNKVEDYSSVSTECLKEAGSKEQIEAEKSEAEEHSTNDGEASHVIKELEERTQDEKPGDPVSVRDEDREAEEKIEEFIDESKLCDDESHIEAVTEVIAETSLNDTEVNGELVSTSHISSVHVSPETIKSDANQVTRVENLQLEEISSDLAPQVPPKDSDEAEKQTLNMETVDKDEADVIKRDPEAFYMPKDQIDEAEKSLTVEKLDQVNSDLELVETKSEASKTSNAYELGKIELASDGNHVSEDKEEEEKVKEGEMLEKEGSQEPETVVDQETTVAQASITEESVEIETIGTVEKLEEEKRKEAEKLEDENCEDSSARETEEICLQKEEPNELHAVPKEEITSGQTLSEEHLHISASALTSQEQEHETKETEDEKTNEGEIIKDEIGEDASDARTTVEICSQKERPVELEAVVEDEMTAGHTLTEKKSEEQVQNPTSALPSKEEECGSTGTTEKIESAKTEEAEFLEIDNGGDTSLQKERLQEDEALAVDDTASAQTIPAEKPEEQIPNPVVTLPSKEHKHETISEVDKTEEEKVKEEEMQNGDSDGGKTVEEISLEKNETREPQAVLEGETNSSQVIAAESQEHGTVREEEKIKEAETQEDDKTQQSECTRELQGALEDGATAAFTLPGEKPEDHLHITTSTLPSEVQGDETKETELQEAESPEKIPEQTREIEEAPNFNGETHERAFDNELLAEIEDAAINEKIVKATDEIGGEENQCEKTNEGNDILQNEVVKEEVMEDKEVTETSYSTSHSEELTKDGSGKDELKDKLIEDETYEEQKAEAQKASEDEIIETKIKDKTVDDPGQASVAGIETTTVTQQVSSIELSAAEGNPIFDDIQQLEETTNIASDEQIPRELDPTGNTEITSSIAKDHVPIDLQDRVAESSQKAEVGDVKEIYPEEVEDDGEKTADNSGEDITEESTSVEDLTKISSSDHVESSTKGALPVTQEILEDREAKDETNASQILLVEEKPKEQSPAPSSKVPSTEGEHGVTTQVDLAEEKELKEVETLDKDSSNTKKGGETCLEKEENKELKAVGGQETIAEDAKKEETIVKDNIGSPKTLPEEKLEEQLQTSADTLPSEDEEVRTAHPIEKIEEEIQKDAEIKHESLEDSSDTKTIEEVCVPNEEQREAKAVSEGETIA